MAPHGPLLRSSDLDDFERAAALKELGELRLAETEYESPHDQPATLVVLHDAHPPSATSPRTSRSNSRTSQRDRPGKIAIFKDEAGRGPHHSLPRSSGKKPVSPLKPKLSKQPRSAYRHSRSRSDSAVDRAEPVTTTPRLPHVTAQDGNATAGAPLASQVPPAPSSSQDLVDRLRKVASVRAGLLQRLYDLGQQENEILDQLAHLSSSPKIGHTRSLSQGDALAALPSTVLVKPLVLPPPAHEPAQLQPMKQAQKPARTKPQHPRVLSAPPKSTSIRSRHRSPSRSKRIPLGDKTEASLAVFDSTPLYSPETCSGSPVEPVEGASGDEHTEVETSVVHGRSVQVPIKLGDDDEEARATRAPMTPIARSNSGGAKAATPARPPARTPGISKDYNVPQPVARKRWEF